MRLIKEATVAGAAGWMDQKSTRRCKEMRDGELTGLWLGGGGVSEVNVRVIGNH